MKFLDFDRNVIRNDSKLSGSYYSYTVGAPIEVTAIRSLHKNELLAKKLSINAKDDGFMTRYCPANKVMFSRGVVENSVEDDFVSCYVDNKECCVYVGTAEEYGRMTGILTFSGYMSLNRMVEENKNILCTSKMRASIMQCVRIMALGLVGDTVYGLLYIPALKGIKVAERDNPDYGVSPITYKSGVARGYQSFTIESWFDELTKIKEM